MTQSEHVKIGPFRKGVLMVSVILFSNPNHPWVPVGGRLIREK